MTRFLSLLLLIALLFTTAGCGSFQPRAAQGAVWQQPQTGTRIGRRIEGQQRERAREDRRTAKPKRERSKPEREKKERLTTVDEDFVPRGGFR